MVLLLKQAKQKYIEYQLNKKLTIGNRGYFKAFGFINRGYRC